MIKTSELDLTVNPVGMQPLTGKRICLVRSGPEHAAFIHQCYRNAEFMGFYRLPQKRTETLKEITDRLRDEHTFLPQQRRSIEWVINLISSEQPDKPIGLAGLADYITAYQLAELLVGLPDKALHRKGLALEAALLVMDFAFNTLHLNKLVSLVYGNNETAQKNTLKLGFRREGYLDAHVYYPEKGYLDMYQNGLLEKEFRVNKRLSRLSKRLLSRDTTRFPATISDIGKDRLEEAKQLLLKQLGI